MMKKNNFKLIIALIGGSLIMTSCGNNSQPNTENQQHEEAMVDDHSNHKHGSMEEDRKVATNTGVIKGDLTVILRDYFALNESLVKDDASSAAAASMELVVSLKDFSISGQTEDEQKKVNEIMESAIENAEHISKNGGNINHQREHLVSLSTDVKDLIAIVGTSQKLYEDFCPMANNSEGAFWISGNEEIRNPYMGSKMPKCGKISRVIE